ncbi:MAG: 50S ribosome-binding GTPase [Planctomycetaceae bacterium]|nr:50S ribosome-binding GTPase [Planctomycetaceae bacterium]
MVGSPPLLEAVLQQLFAHGARPAQRGEFTLRAFLAGRIDLMQAEAVLGVIEATDQQQLKTALDQLGGGLSQRIAALHEELLLHLADLEAGLDFIEEDIEFVSREQLSTRLQSGRELLSGLISQSSTRMQSTGRHKVVLAGLPNAGKSTLLNALSDQEAAIVSQTAGTTRDYLCVPLDWNGLAIELIDTAGWDRTDGPDEEKSIAQDADHLRDGQWKRADLILWCTAADVSRADTELDASLREECRQAIHPLIRLTTKSDLPDTISGEDTIPVSAATGKGLNDVRTAVTTQLQLTDCGNQILGTTAARCLDSLRGAHDALSRAQDAAAAKLGDELIAVELREAIDHLGLIAGRVFTDDILDRIFSRFCIGK